jgi:hypothetical protein
LVLAFGIMAHPGDRHVLPAPPDDEDDDEVEATSFDPSRDISPSIQGDSAGDDLEMSEGMLEGDDDEEEGEEE